MAVGPSAPARQSSPDNACRQARDGRRLLHLFLAEQGRHDLLRSAHIRIHRVNAAQRGHAAIAGTLQFLLENRHLLGFGTTNGTPLPSAVTISNSPSVWAGGLGNVSRNCSAWSPMVRLMCSKALTETVCWNTACNCSAPTPNAFSTQNSCENSSNR